MLSFIYRIATEYEKSHGFQPNLLYLNQEHFDCLCGDLVEIKGLGNICRLLGMQIVLERELLHPHVYWTDVNWKRAVSV